jgi:RimJ/RimL family protein N-acetyltransferase
MVLSAAAGACDGDGVEVRLYDGVAAFADVAWPMLHGDPVRHTIAVTVLGELSSPYGPYHEATLLTVHDNEALRGAALRVGQWPLITSALLPSSAAAVAEVLSTVANPPRGAHGPKDNVEAFATAWSRRTGETARVARNQRLFRLGELRPLGGVPGVFRVADAHDIALLARWRREFATTRVEGWRHAEDPTEHVARRLATGETHVLWEVGGEPVAMAAASKPIAAMSRIGPVWTPPHRPGRGYGSAVTVAASRWAMTAGAVHVVLFTDLANLVSNSIYPKIGYRPVHDAVELTFIPATSSTNA